MSRSKEAEHFREVAGVSIIDPGGPCIYAVDTSTVDSRVA